MKSPHLATTRSTRSTATHLAAPWLVLLLVLSACGGTADEAQATAETAEMEMAHNTLSADEVAAGWELIFDGTSTSGWRGYGRDDMPNTWVAENGELVLQASSGNMDGGDIMTVAEFTDFELTFDFKVGPEGNSGVFYRVAEAPEKGLWQVAAEYQVLDDVAYIDMGTMDMNTHLTGDNYDLQATPSKTMYPTGEWNSGRILIEGNHVEHWLNGAMTVQYDLYSDEWEELVANSKFGTEEFFARAPSGSIALQDHGTPVWFRNMKIRPIG